MSDSLHLATCSYSEYRPEMGVAIRTSLGMPKWFKYPVAMWWQSVTPTGPMLRMGLEEYEPAYRRRLESFGIEQLQDERRHIEAAVKRMYSGQEPERLVLLCFEGLKNPKKWCHRRLFAGWWEEKTGESVVELGKTPSPVERFENAATLF